MTESNCITKLRTFKHLNEIQRGRLAEMLESEKKLTQKEMAKKLGVSQSTTSREIKRGQVKQMNTHRRYYEKYIPETAQIRYTQNRDKCKRKQSLENYDATFFVALKTELKRKPKERIYSVDTFVNCYKKHNPDKKVPCTKTVYKLIDNSLVEGLTNINLPMKVRLRKRKAQSSKPKGTNKKILGKSIDKRDEKVLEREEAGHWEFDLVEGKKGGYNVLTMVERLGRYSIFKKVPKNAKDVLEISKKAIKEATSKGIAFKTITTDNGSEFASLHKLNNFFDLY